MEAYRDQYATIFNGGKGVMVIGISVDADTTLADWARELGTPVLFASDPRQDVAKRYGAAREGRAFDLRHVYVVGPDGRIAAKLVPFNELSNDAYVALGQAVARARGDSAHGR